MKKFAMVQTNGEVVSVVSPATDDYYVDGVLYGEQVAREIPLDSNDVSYIIGKYWNNGFHDKPGKPSNAYAWIDYTWVFDSEIFWLNVRDQRNVMLSASDWTQINDAPITSEKKADWATYRQALRDLPSSNISAINIDDIIYPTKPEA
jgi:hypothetical protein